MFTNVQSILEQIITDITPPVTALIPNITINIDEPLNLIVSDLPNISIYPVREDFIYDESTSNNESKRLTVRLELRMTGGPASIVCSPIINAISDTIKADLRLHGLAKYVERQGIEWANENVSSAQICGSSLDIQIDYYV